MLYVTEEKRDTHVFGFKLISTLKEQDVYFGGSAKGNLVKYRYVLFGVLFNYHMSLYRREVTGLHCFLKVG